MTAVLKGAVWEGFLGEGNLEDFFCLEKKGTVVGYLCDPNFIIYALYSVMHSETTNSK